jgi:CBS domain-containing protein
MPPRRTPLTLERIMSSDVISVKASDAISRAYIDMQTAGVRHLPVVDEANRVIGIVSSRDLVPAITGSDRSLTLVHQVMNPAIRTARRDTLPAVAASLMIEEKIGALPVVDDAGVLVGIVTETDFLRFARDVLARADEAITKLEQVTARVRGRKVDGHA